MPTYNSKVVLGNEVLIDLTSDTVDASHLLYGYTAHGKDGAPITGSCTYDADTSDATASPAEILSGQTAYKNGAKITGQMTNNASVTGYISDKTVPYAIASGYHDGGGTVDIDSTEKAKIIEGNIKAGVSILGVVGNYSGEAVNAQAKTVTSSLVAQTVLPDTGYDYLSEVTVNAIPVSRVVDPTTGGTFVTIG